MKKIWAFFVCLVLSCNFLYAQKDTTRIVLKKQAFLNKKYIGVYISAFSAKDPNTIVPGPPGVFMNGLGANTTYTYANIKQTPGISEGFGLEFMWSETGRYYGSITAGASFPRYTVSAMQTQTQYIYSTGAVSSWQSNVKYLVSFINVNVFIKNYIRIVETERSRLALGLNLGITFVASSTNDYLSLNNGEEEGLISFVSPSLRYDVAIGSNNALAFECFYDYELGQSAMRTVPGINAVGLRVVFFFPSL